MEHFIDAGFVADPLRGVTEKALAGTSGAPDEVGAFVGAVKELYKNMDPSLRFRPVAQGPPPETAEDSQEAAPTAIRVDREENFVGVVCPLNYVKTKMVLAQMEGGQTLAVLVDEEGARNVPDSVTKDGHKGLASIQDGKTWRVLIRKSEQA